jgi:hypothetical protein
MSLSTWEQQALDSIKDRLTGTDPRLAALLTTFTRLALAEEMPAQETIPAASRRALRWPLRKPRHNCRADGCRRSRPMLGHAGLRWAALLAWLVTTAVLITVALAINHGGTSPDTCTGSWPTLCTHSAPG